VHLSNITQAQKEKYLLYDEKGYFLIISGFVRLPAIVPTNITDRTDIKAAVRYIRLYD
jgi:hypothetical protein